MDRGEAERNRSAEERERDRQAGLAFSEKLREAYEASRYQDGLRWLKESGNPGDRPDPPDETA